MPRKRSRQLDLNDDAKIRALRPFAKYPRVHPVTGAISIWSSVWQDDWNHGGEARKKAVLIVTIPPRTARNAVEVICEKLGCPPPWIPRVDRKEWRLAWRRRYGAPDRAPRLPRTQLVQANMEAFEDTRDSFEGDEDEQDTPGDEEATRGEDDNTNDVHNLGDHSE